MTNSSILPPRDLASLKLIVFQRLRETTTLEFKRQLPQAGKNDDMAAAIAAMANTAGGVLIYGVEQDKTGAAMGLNSFPIAGAPERIALVSQSLDEPVRLEEVYSIEEPSRLGFGYIVVSCSISERSPHFQNGIAWGRTPKGKSRLSRRQVGQLFANSQGFATEFGVVAGKPGRLAVRFETESNLNSLPSAGGYVRDFMILVNDGDQDIYNATWVWKGLTGGDPLTIGYEGFPISTLPHGGSVRLELIRSISDDLRTAGVETSWVDTKGRLHSQVWPVSI